MGKFGVRVVFRLVGSLHFCLQMLIDAGFCKEQD